MSNWPARFLHYESTTLLPFLLLRMPVFLAWWAVLEFLFRRLLGLHGSSRGRMKPEYEPGGVSFPTFRLLAMIAITCGPLLVLSSFWSQLGGSAFTSVISFALRVAAASCLWIWPDFERGMDKSASFLFRYVTKLWRAVLTTVSLLALVLKLMGLPLPIIEHHHLHVVVSSIITTLPRRRVVAFARLGTWLYFVYFIIAFLPHTQLLSPAFEQGKITGGTWRNGFRINPDRRYLPLSQRFTWPRMGESATFAAAPYTDIWYDHDMQVKREQQEEILFRRRIWSIRDLREELIAKGKDPEVEYESVVKEEREQGPSPLSESPAYHRYLSLVQGQREPDVRDLSLLNHYEEGGEEAILRSNLIRYHMFMDKYAAKSSGLFGGGAGGVSAKDGDYIYVPSSNDGGGGGGGGGDSGPSGLDQDDVLESLLLRDNSEGEREGESSISSSGNGGVGATLFNLGDGSRFRLSPGAAARMAEHSDLDDEDEEEDYDEYEYTEYEEEEDEDYGDAEGWYDSDEEEEEVEGGEGIQVGISGLPGALPTHHNALEMRRSPLLTDPYYRFSLLYPDDTVFNASIVGVYMSRLPQNLFSALVVDVMKDVEQGPIGAWAAYKKIPTGYLTSQLTTLLTRHLQDVTVAMSDAMLYPVAPIQAVVPLNYAMIKEEYEQSLRMDAPDSYYQQFDCMSRVDAKYRGPKRVKRRRKARTISTSSSTTTTTTRNGAAAGEDPDEVYSSRLTYGRAWAKEKERKKSLWQRMRDRADSFMIGLEVLLGRDISGKTKK